MKMMKKKSKNRDEQDGLVRQKQPNSSSGGGPQFFGSTQGPQNDYHAGQPISEHQQQQQQQIQQQYFSRHEQPEIHNGRNGQETMGGTAATLIMNPTGADIDLAHALTTKIRGESEVEALGARIEERQKDRITVINSVRTRFVVTCRKLSLAEHQDGKDLEVIHISTLRKWRDEVLLRTQKPTSKSVVAIQAAFGFRSADEQMLSILEKAMEVVTFQKDRHFHFMDFNVYYVRTESRWPWMRSSSLLSVLTILFFYSFTPVLFCYIAPDQQICPQDPTDSKRDYYGPFTALYFASATLSTVGYGDVTVSKDADWRILLGLIYMIFANVMLIVAFSNAASSVGIMDNINQKFLQWIWGQDDSELVYRKVRRATFIRIGQISLTFIFLNFIGVLVVKMIVDYGPRNDHEQEIKLNWIEAVYWAVQTTTTIGYGDYGLTMNVQIFQIFYLILSTYFVGNTLGGLAALKDEIAEIISRTAWSRRKLSRGLIDELQPYEHDGRIDQYEWAIASLMILGKVQYDELVPIMDKFRELAADSGFIESPMAEEYVEGSDEEEARGGTAGAGAAVKTKTKKKKKEENSPQKTLATDREVDIPSHIECDADDDLGEFGRGMMTLFGLNIQ